jgi:cytochrome o ubiquinol oxidase subunit 2
MKRASLIAIGVLGAGVVAMALVMQGVHIPVLEPMGPIASAERRVILVTFLLISIIVIPVFFLLFFFAWKYRAHSPQVHVHHHPNWDHDNAAAEFIWWMVPSVIIAVLAVIAWQGSHTLDPYVPIEGGVAPLTVQVVALDWKWLFIYPDQGVASVNELTIPEGTPVHFLLTADAPMNSFWIPSLGGQIYAMPGMQTELNLAADATGTFDGLSGNLSGKGFSGMTFKVRSVSEKDFVQWASDVRSKWRPLDVNTYDRLARESENDPVSYFFPVDGGLYTSIYMKFMPHSVRTSI